VPSSRLSSFCQNRTVTAESHNRIGSRDAVARQKVQELRSLDNVARPTRAAHPDSLPVSPEMRMSIIEYLGLWWTEPRVLQNGWAIPLNRRLCSLLAS
jgi:hypothetical protein